MIEFVDGPAAGQTLMLRRTPILLRVVCRLKPADLFGSPAERTAWDALDELSDEPKPDEEIHVYHLASVPTSIHFLVRGKGKKDLGGCWPMASYAYLPEQPGEGTKRERTAWYRWADEHAPAIVAAFNLGVL